MEHVPDYQQGVTRAYRDSEWLWDIFQCVAKYFKKPGVPREFYFDEALTQASATHRRLLALRGGVNTNA